MRRGPAPQSGRGCDQRSSRGTRGLMAPLGQSDSLMLMVVLCLHGKMTLFVGKTQSSHEHWSILCEAHRGAVQEHTRRHTCECTCTHVCTRTHAQTCTHMQTCAHMRVHTHAHTHTCVHTRAPAHTHAHARTHRGAGGEMRRNPRESGCKTLGSSLALRVPPRKKARRDATGVGPDPGLIHRSLTTQHLGGMAPG